MAVHILKLSVGTESVEGLQDWQLSPHAQGPDGLPRHVTRMFPRRASEVLDGGSIYWVIKGQILARQPILRLDPLTGADGITRCAIVLDKHLTRTQPAPRRPFQGWRYLNPADAPPDLPDFRDGDDALPPGMAEALAEFGLR